MQHLSMKELESGLEEILRAPKDKGRLRLIVKRPETNERQTLDVGELDLLEGLVGDNWYSRGNKRTVDGNDDPDM